MKWSNEKETKKTNKGPQNITRKIKLRVPRIPLKTWGELMCSGRITIPSPLFAPVLLLLNTLDTTFNK